MENYINAKKYLKHISIRGSRLGLERITELCHRIGNPQNDIPVIHVAGTNGKGSFVVMLNSILSNAGYTVGSFLSPAITEITDSFRIKNNKISNEYFGKLVCEIIPECEAMIDKPTEFEVLTASAYHLFSQTKCDIAIVECGMGGKFDSTNVISKPILSVITNIAIDHTSFLGNTIQEIASLKAGIIKKHTPVLYGGNNIIAQKIIHNKAKENFCWYITTDHSLTNNIRSDINGTTLNYSDFGDIHTPLIGTFQQYNIANTLNAVKILRNIGIKLPNTTVKFGLKNVCWHGRFELLNRNPVIIFDGAHNPDGIRNIAESIKQYFRGKVALLIGVMAEKQYQIYPKMLSKYAIKVFAVKPNNPRSLESNLLAKIFIDAGVPSEAFVQFSDGVKKAVTYADKNGLPLIALGSLYMYRDFTETLNKILSE